MRYIIYFKQIASRAKSKIPIFFTPQKGILISATTHQEVKAIANITVKNLEDLGKGDILATSSGSTLKFEPVNQIAHQYYCVYIMENIPNNDDAELYKNRYIWLDSKQELYFFKGHALEQVPIKNIEYFNKLFENVNIEENHFNISVETIKKYITNNGGHSPFTITKTFSINLLAELLMNNNIVFKVDAELIIYNYSRLGFEGSCAKRIEFDLNMPEYAYIDEKDITFPGKFEVNYGGVYPKRGFFEAHAAKPFVIIDETEEVENERKVTKTNMC